MKLVLIGIQGSGKSTQGNLLSKQLKLPYLSTGHIFRHIAREKNNIGRYIKETLNAGLLIPDEKTIPIVEEYLSRPEYKKGYILDGFPRTLPQTKQFKNHVDRVIYIDVPQQEALWRIAYRNDKSREDETLQGIKKRIELFQKVTHPVISYYEKKGKLITVDGTKSIEIVNNDILTQLGKKLAKNGIRQWEHKQKILIAVVGLPGAGKTEATQFLAKKKLPVVHFGDIVNHYIDKNNLSHTELLHKKIREQLRQKHGMAAFAKLSMDKLKDTFKKNRVVIIDGMRSFEEYDYLKGELKEIRIVLIHVWAKKNLRYERIAKRGTRSEVRGLERDKSEVINLNIGPTIALSDYLITNNTSVADLHEMLDRVYREIYFS